MKRKGKELTIFSASRNGTIQKRLALQGSVIRKKTFDQPITAFVPYGANPGKNRGSQALFAKGGELFLIDWETLETQSLFQSKYRNIGHIASGPGGRFVAIAGKIEGKPGKSSVTILENDSRRPQGGGGSQGVP